MDLDVPDIQPVTPTDVIMARFRSPQPGSYDRYEVDAFLERVLVTLRTENKVDRSLSILAAAQDTADSLVAEAREEAEQLRQEIEYLKKVGQTYRSELLRQIGAHYKEIENLPLEVVKNAS